MLKKFLSKRKYRDMAWLVLGFIGLVLVNYAGGIRFARLDMTAEQRYSLTDSTKKILRELDEPVLFKIYLEGDFSANFKKLRQATIEVLEEFKAYAGDNIEYVFIDPYADPNEQVQADVQKELWEKGIMPVNDFVQEKGKMSDNLIYPGAVVSKGADETSVMLMSTDFFATEYDDIIKFSVEKLEYRLITTIHRLNTAKNRKKVVFSIGHGELAEKEIFIESAASFLQEFYSVEKVTLNKNVDALQPNDKVLIIAKPTQPFNDTTLFIIDQFVMNGGRVLWLIDNLVYNQDSLARTGMTIAERRYLNLQPMLFQYGVRINDDLLLDEICSNISINVGSVGDKPDMRPFPWVFYPVMLSNGNHPISKNLGNGVRMEYGSTLTPADNENVQHSILLESSKHSKIYRLGGARISFDIVKKYQDILPTFTQEKLSTAVLLEGKFLSVFTNRIVEELGNRKYVGSIDTNKMIVVSDGDVIKNRIDRETGQPALLGLDYDNRAYQSGNLTFLLNAVNYLADDAWIIPLRDKEFVMRPLDQDKIKKHSYTVQLLNILLPVLLVIIFGVVFHFIRKRKYA